MVRVKVGEECTRACCGVVGSGVELVRVVHIKAVGNGKSEDGGGNEAVLGSHGCENGGGQSPINRGGARDVGGVIGGTKVLVDFCPHRSAG